MSWDARLSFAILHPSEFLGEPFEVALPITPIANIRFNEVINQRTINSINEPHIGLATSFGDFTAVADIYETSESLAVLDELRTKNQYFDVVYASLDEGAGTDWKVEQTLIIGCKIGTRTRTYRYGETPTRSYNITYLKTSDKEERNGNVYNVPFGDGNLHVRIVGTATDRSETLEIT